MEYENQFLFQETYMSRFTEINKVLKFLISLDSIRAYDDDGLCNQFYAELFVNSSTVGEEHTQEDIRQVISNSSKANVYLMIYNLIEFTVSNLLQAIYDRVEGESCSYLEVNKDLKEIWHHCKIRSAINDFSANGKTMERISWNIVDDVIKRNIIQLDPRKTMQGGNLDGETIKHTMEKHGIHITNLREVYRPDKLKEIREKRNGLAHGLISFSEAGSQVTVSDLEDLANSVKKFLDQLMQDVALYIRDRKYMEQLG